MPTPVQQSPLAWPARRALRSLVLNQGCVVRRGRGLLRVRGRTAPGPLLREELGPRNVLLCLLSQNRAMHKGRLAGSLDVSVEMLRLLRQCWEREGLESRWAASRGWLERKANCTRQRADRGAVRRRRRGDGGAAARRRPPRPQPPLRGAPPHRLASPTREDSGESPRRPALWSPREETLGRGCGSSVPIEEAAPTSRLWPRSRK